MRLIKLSCAAAAIVLCAPGDSAAGVASSRRVLIIGDSIMYHLSRSLEVEGRRRDGVTTHSFTSLGSGISRLDVFDWFEKIRELSGGFRPDSAIVMLGANDHQPMKTATGVVRPDTPEWEAEYGRRVGEIMDTLHAGGAARVYWIALPDMRAAAVQAMIGIFNRIFGEQAARRSFVTVIESKPVLSRNPGTFSPFVIQPTGMPLQVRDADGVHLNRDGADLLARHIAGQIWKGSDAK